MLDNGLYKKVSVHLSKVLFLKGQLLPIINTELRKKKQVKKNTKK